MTRFFISFDYKMSTRI